MKLEAKELRIGNWLQDFSGKCSKWVYEDFDLLRHAEVDELAKPIPLTPEILEAAGFEIINGDYCVLNISGKQEYEFKYDADGLFYGFSSENGFVKESKALIYVHQLQNLYFALTFEELSMDYII